jgi:hypothetical protein
MEKIVAYCGIVCSECGAFLATKNNDNAKRKQVAEEWSKAYGHTMKPEDINCTGCTSGKGKKLGYCAVCEIRNCGSAKGIKNCAYCDSYPCGKLGAIFQRSPEIKTNLNEIRESLRN